MTGSSPVRDADAGASVDADADVIPGGDAGIAGATSAPSMSSPARRWLVLVAAVCMVALTARLGVWQIDRAAEKIARQRSFDERSAMPELTPFELPADAGDIAPVVNRRVRLLGEWLPAFTVFLDNRPMDGREGFYVVTPLRIAGSGRIVAIQRGWSPRAFDDRTRLQPVATPPGEVVVTGRIAPAPSRLYEFGGAASGVIRQNLDLAGYAREIGAPMAGWSVVQGDSNAGAAAVAETAKALSSGTGTGTGTDVSKSKNFTAGAGAPAGDGLSRHWPRPANDVQRNYGYAFQWFALCALTAVLYVWFQLIRPRLGSGRRRAA